MKNVDVLIETLTGKFIRCDFVEVFMRKKFVFFIRMSIKIDVT
jgi:hypothetical protein